MRSVCGFFYRRRLFDSSLVVDGRLRGARGDRRHHGEPLRVSRPVRGPQGVQQPAAAEPLRRRQHGVHNQRTVDSALVGMASAVVVHHRQRRTGTANNEYCNY